MAQAPAHPPLITIRQSRGKKRTRFKGRKLAHDTLFLRNWVTLKTEYMLAHCCPRQSTPAVHSLCRKPQIARHLYRMLELAEVAIIDMSKT
jgi:hypothetical protein